MLSWTPCAQLHMRLCEVPAVSRQVDASSAVVVAALGWPIDTCRLFVDVLLDYAMGRKYMEFLKRSASSYLSMLPVHIYDRIL